MPKCKFKMEVDGKLWECPLEALPGEEYCYWHKPEDGKRPTKEQIEELKRHELFGIYLKYANLKDLNLRWVSLKNSKLEKVNFENTKLQWANLKDSDLSGVNLRNARLKGAVLKNAVIKDVKFENTNLDWTNLEDAILENLKLQKISFDLTKLNNAKIKDVTLRDCSLRGTELENTTLKRVTFENSMLEGAKFRNANLIQVDFIGTSLKGATFENAHLDKVNFQDNSNLSIVNFKKARLEHVILKKINLESAIFESTYFNSVNLSQAMLRNAKLKNAELKEVDLQSADLMRANLKNANLTKTNLKKANLKYSTLEKADLWGTNLESANLENVKLKGADLYFVLMNSQTKLTEAELLYSNLYKSYVDQTPTFRDAHIFNDDPITDINEIASELLKRNELIDFEKLKRIDKKLANDLMNEGYVYYVADGKKVILFDRREGLLKEPSMFVKSKRIRLRKHFNLRKNNKKSMSKATLLEIKLQQEYKKHKEEILYEANFGTIQELYNASYEVYNKLYYFYLQNGKLEEALQMHYRRNEVRRKLRLTKGLKSKLRAYLYDWLVLKVLTGYGTKPERPLMFSLFTILIFTLLFRLTNGIVKVVNGKSIPADWLDYLYHSVITFTSLGYANIQPNLTTHIPQLLVSLESFLGLLLMSLFLYTVTFRISR
ncbi:pentapeptide repeat-containing protein [Thermococcus sp.]|uniref:pentapeptide repeat-containing protein n=1 Tax=Thermococcus sp. TaxID=35749 RepID=UPI002615E045|nr:pentapeptide repeat-containing protein [Thermococcus sp.]